MGLYILGEAEAQIVSVINIVYIELEKVFIGNLKSLSY